MDGDRLEPKAMRDLNDSDWWARIDALGEREGYFEPLGTTHAALFADRGPVLLVSFETRTAIRARSDDQLPLGFTLAEAAGHSSLTLIAQGETWFRDATVYAYFDRLVDEAFFEDFDRVVFYGAGSCGYAAAAYSVAAPGASVLALAPQATLAVERAGWDSRFRKNRRLDFSNRYGYAPDMLDSVGQGFVVFDPAKKFDSMHAALLARPQVTLLACPLLGADIEAALTEIDVLEPMLTQLCAGTFKAETFWRLYRARRNSMRYLRRVSAHLETTGRPWLEAILCRSVVNRLGGPRFRIRLSALETNLAKQGITLPAPLEKREQV